jgi:hypothetical protein
MSQSNMAAQVGAPLVFDGNQRAIAVPQLGASSTLTTGAASADIALPVDANGKAYRAYRVAASAACWVTFGDVAQTAVAGNANNVLIPAGYWDYVVAPLGATHVAGIQDSAAGKCCFTGIF